MRIFAVAISSLRLLFGVAFIAKPTLMEQAWIGKQARLPGAQLLARAVGARDLVVERVYVGYWFWGRPSVHRLWDDAGEVLRRIKADFDPTTAAARAAWEGMRAAA